MREIPCHYALRLFVRLAGRGEHPRAVPPLRHISRHRLQVASPPGGGRTVRPSGPRHSPSRSSDDITELLRMVHELHQHWGARKIKRWPEDGMPAFSTVHSLMARHPAGRPLPVLAVPGALR